LDIYEIDAAAGETIDTENSYKYSLTEMDEVSKATEQHAERCRQDAEGRFSLRLPGINPAER
jgi:hypothetical protein